MTEHQSQQGFLEVSNQKQTLGWLETEENWQKLWAGIAKIDELEQKLAKSDEKVQKLTEIIENDLIPGQTGLDTRLKRLETIIDDGRVILNGSGKMCERMDKLERMFNVLNEVNNILVGKLDRLPKQTQRIEALEEALYNIERMTGRHMGSINDGTRTLQSSGDMNINAPITIGLPVNEHLHCSRTVNSRTGHPEIYKHSHPCPDVSRPEQEEQEEQEDAFNSLESRVGVLCHQFNALEARFKSQGERGVIEFNAQQKFNHATTNTCKMLMDKISSKDWYKLDSVQAQLNQLSDKLFVATRDESLRNRTWLCKACRTNVEFALPHDCPVAKLRLFDGGNIIQPIPNADKTKAAIEAWADWAETDQPIDRLMQTKKIPVEVRDPWDERNSHLRQTLTKKGQVIIKGRQNGADVAFVSVPAEGATNKVNTTLDLLLGDLERQCTPAAPGEHPRHVPLAATIQLMREYVTNSFRPSMRIGVDYEYGTITCFVPDQEFSVTFGPDAKMAIEKLQ